MAIGYVGQAVGAKAGATSGNSTIALDSGLTGGTRTAVQAGDFVVAIYSTASTANRTLAISGYTLIDAELYANDTFDANLRVAWKFMGASPDASVSFGPTGSTLDAGAMQVRVYSGVDPLNPLDVAAIGITGINSALPNPSAITPITPGAMIVAVGTGATQVVATYASADLDAFVANSASDTYISLLGAGHKEWTGGTFDPAAFTGLTANTAHSWAAITFAMRPDPDLGAWPTALDKWTRRKRHRITASASAGTNYQVPLWITNEIATDAAGQAFTGGNARSDFADLRFTDVAGNLLDYWIEQSDGYNAKVWIEIAEDLASARDIYIYYGNSAAAAGSSGAATFPFFDDFSGTTLDTSKWQAFNGSYSLSGGELHATGTTDPTKLIAVGAPLESYYAMRARFRVNTGTHTDQRIGIGLKTNTTDGYGYNLCLRNFAAKDVRQMLNDTIAWDANAYAEPWGAGQWYAAEITHDGTTLAGRWDDGPWRTWVVSGRAGYPALNIGGYLETVTNDWDYALVRKFVAAEPGHGGWTAETTHTPAPSGGTGGAGTATLGAATYYEGMVGYVNESGYLTGSLTAELAPVGSTYGILTGYGGTPNILWVIFGDASAVVAALSDSKFATLYIDGVAYPLLSASPAAADQVWVQYGPAPAFIDGQAYQLSFSAPGTPSSISAALTEAAAAADSQSVNAARVRAIVEAATASDVPAAVAARARAIVEAAGGVDAIAASKATFVGVMEMLAIGEQVDAIVTRAAVIHDAAIAEAVAGADAGVVDVFAAAGAIEVAAPLDALVAIAVFAPQIVEAANVTAAHPATLEMLATAAETAAVADSSISGSALTAQSQEAGAANAAQGATSGANAARVESSPVSELVAATGSGSRQVSETAGAADLSSAVALFLAAITEAGVPSDGVNAGLSIVTSLAEAAVAGEMSASTRATAMGILELSVLAETASAIAHAQAGAIEAVASADAVLALLAAQASLAEAAVAGDMSDRGFAAAASASDAAAAADIAAASSSAAAGAVEPAVAAEITSAIASLSAGRLEGAAAADVVAAQLVTFAQEISIALADADQDAAREIFGADLAAALTEDEADALLSRYANLVEELIAADSMFATGGDDHFADMEELAFAADHLIAQAIANAAIGESALASEIVRFLVATRARQLAAPAGEARGFTAEVRPREHQAGAGKRVFDSPKGSRRFSS